MHTSPREREGEIAFSVLRLVRGTQKCPVDGRKYYSFIFRFVYAARAQSSRTDFSIISMTVIK